MRKLVAGFVMFVGLAVLGGGLMIAVVARTIPSPELIERRQTAETTKIYDRTGEVLLYELHGNEKRTVVPFAEIPLTLRQAILAAEDANFYGHRAFDWRAILRAALANLRTKRVAQGGSTITQQLAKNAFLTPERTFTRKIRELILARELERRYTKDEILGLYLNQIPFGANAYGVEAASQLYFSKSVRDLVPAESAVLAAMIRAPTYYSPWGSHREELLARRDTILARMGAAGSLTEKEMEGAREFAVTFRSPAAEIRAPHFVIAVQEYLNNQYGEDFVRRGGLRVITTLDWNLQEHAERAVAEGAARNEELYQGKNAALVAEDAETGQVLAMVGSRDYFDETNGGNFNVATQGLRQPGSAIKPFVYVTAFKKGYAPETILFDVGTEFDTTGNPEKSYKPQNFDEQFRGPVSLRNALAQSLNIPSVKVLYLAGIDEVLRTAREFGISTLTERGRYGLSLVLGGGEVTLADLVGGYSVFAQEGIRHPQTLVLSVETKEKALERFEEHPKQIVEAQYARLINDILSDVEARSHLFSRSLGLTTFPDRDVALKTGTTDDFRDAWVIGYTRTLVVGVWAGNNDNTPMQRRGGSILAAVPIWHAFMAEALKTRPPQAFTKPDPISPVKPVLAGEYLVNYKAGEEIHPQIHNILFYVNRRDPTGKEPERPDADPQFQNWEEPVLAWARDHLPDFERYNKPLPPGSVPIFASAIATGTPQALTVSIQKPEPGTFLGETLEVESEVKGDAAVASIELYMNEHLIETKRLASATGTVRYEYRGATRGIPLELQNTLRVVARDSNETISEARVIVYR